MYSCKLFELWPHFSGQNVNGQFIFKHGLLKKFADASREVLFDVCCL
jgi:hypothetical protein